MTSLLQISELQTIKQTNFNFNNSCTRARFKKRGKGDPRWARCDDEITPAKQIERATKENYAHLDCHQKSCEGERGCDLGRLEDPFQDSEEFMSLSYA